MNCMWPCPDLHGTRDGSRTGKNRYRTAPAPVRTGMDGSQTSNGVDMGAKTTPIAGR